MTCVEIYHEQVYDLLAPITNNSSESIDLESKTVNVREHVTEGFFLEGCHVIPVKSSTAALHSLIVALNSRRSRG